jgi:hypothetical protein
MGAALPVVETDMAKPLISAIAPLFIVKDVGFELQDADGYVLFFGRPRS